MKKTSLDYRTALALSAAISLLMNLLFLVMYLYGREAVLPPDIAHARRGLELSHVLLQFFSNFFVAFVLYMVNFRLIRFNISTQHKWLLVVSITIISTAIISYISSNIQLHFHNNELHPERFLRGAMFRDYFIAIIVVLSSQLLHLSRKQQQTALENESLQAENMRTRFTALKNQVDPHFLFNSLNTLNSLIKVDADKAQEYVQQLSYVFRYTLQNKEVISLYEELKFTQSYSHLMQIRYGENLQLIYQIDEKYNLFSVIPLSIQTLVENAIKHNIVSNKQPLTITIATHKNNTISISNPIQLKREREVGEGIGLTNLAERYKLMWKKDIAVKHSDSRFEVIIPLVEE